MTNCIGTEGVKFTLTNRSRHKVCRHINALKGNLTSSMLQDRSLKQNRHLEKWRASTWSFQPLDVITQELCVLLNAVRYLWLLLLTDNCNCWLEGTKQWDDKNNVTVWFPVKAELNKNKTQISNHPLKNKTKKAYLTIQSPVSIYSSAYLNKSLTNVEPSSGTIYSS